MTREAYRELLDVSATGLANTPRTEELRGRLASGVHKKMLENCSLKRSISSGQKIRDGDLLIGLGQRSDVSIGRHDRDVGITKSSGPIRVGARAAINLELAIDEVDDPIVTDAGSGVTMRFNHTVVPQRRIGDFD